MGDFFNSWLDLCLADKQDNVVDFWKTESPFADGHDLLTATLDLHTPKPIPPSFSYRNYKAICATTLTEYLKGLDLSGAQSAPLQDCVDILQTHVSSAI